MRWDRSKGRPEPVALLDRVPLVEYGEPLVDIRIVAPSIKIFRPQTIPYVRESVARMAQQATELLPKGFHMGVTDAWRPFKRQLMIYEMMTKFAQEAYPLRQGPSLTRTVNRWVAPPGRKAPPGHCTGAAIDLVLMDDAGEVIDVSAPFDRIRGGPTYVEGLEAEARKHRFMLVEAMLTVGFSNCRDEWWHYSYGDAGWAVRLEKDHCIYGLIDLDPEVYLQNQIEWEEAHAKRENPFLPPPSA